MLRLRYKWMRVRIWSVTKCVMDLLRSSWNERQENNDLFRFSLVYRYNIKDDCFELCTKISLSSVGDFIGGCIHLCNCLETGGNWWSKRVNASRLTRRDILSMTQETGAPLARRHAKEGFLFGEIPTERERIEFEFCIYNIFLLKLGYFLSVIWSELYLTKGSSKNRKLI